MQAPGVGWFIDESKLSAVKVFMKDRNGRQNSATSLQDIECSIDVICCSNFQSMRKQQQQNRGGGTLEYSVSASRTATALVLSWSLMTNHLDLSSPPLMTDYNSDEQSRKKVCHEHNWPDEVRQLCVSLVEGRTQREDAPTITSRLLSSYSAAPPRRTIDAWLQHEKNKEMESSSPLQSSTSYDHRSLLSDEQLKVMGGFALWRLKVKRPPHVADVRNFVALAFHLNVNQSWVSQHMADLGFRARRVRGEELKYTKKKAVPACVDFLKQVRVALQAAAEERQILAVDQICVWDNGLCTVAYGVIGGYELTRLGHFSVLLANTMLVWSSHLSHRVLLSCC